MFSSQSVCKSETAKTRSSESDGKEEVLDPIFCLPKMCLHDFSARRVDFHFHVGGGYRLASFSVAVFQNFQLSVGVPSTMQVPNTGIPPSKSITWGTVAVLEVDAVNDVITDDYIQELCLSLEKDSVGRSGTGNHGSGGTGGQSGIANANHSRSDPICFPKHGRSQNWTSHEGEHRSKLEEFQE
jgi:hypothetical protein